MISLFLSCVSIRLYSSVPLQSANEDISILRFGLLFKDSTIESSLGLNCACISDLL